MVSVVVVCGPSDSRAAIMDATTRAKLALGIQVLMPRCWVRTVATNHMFNSEVYGIYRAKSSDRTKADRVQYSTLFKHPWKAAVGLAEVQCSCLSRRPSVHYI